MIRQAITPDEFSSRLEALKTLDEQQVKVCTKCKLSETRHKTVFGQGDAATRLVFVGEAPGHDEDMQGLAFVGKAGQLLTKMIEAMGITRQDLYKRMVLYRDLERVLAEAAPYMAANNVDTGLVQLALPKEIWS